ncbi:MAG TPA: 2-oxoglutarate dehydrogenase E1 component [Pirellulales bacterium]|nr:2-oxoglutarate dehydrogenase E1 component [Pirellulales bacterium]
MLNLAKSPKKEAEPSPNSLSLGFIESLYADYLADPASVSADWRRYFKQLTNGSHGGAIPQPGPSFRPSSLFNPPGRRSAAADERPREFETALLQDRLDQLVRAYRVRGHMLANLDPLGMPRQSQPELDPEYYGFTEADMDRPFSTDTIRGPDVLTLRRILARLRNTYCRSIGVQFMHMDDLSVRQWLQDRMEGTENRLPLARQEQLRILRRLTNAVIFEEFIQKRFLGSKSFSLEGAESLIPLLDLTIEKAGEQGIREIVLGMAHRGRLNVLANVMNKSAQEIFREFSDIDPKLHLGRGDVKYHLGYSSDWMTDAGQKVHVTLCFNPSHLEFVNPVVLGRVRSKQDRTDDTKRQQTVAILIHGDAAIAGEGVVQETFNLSQLPGYATGGTLHVVINNQIGFITSPSEARSTIYATDIAKMLQIPIFHVNGEDPEAVAQVVRLAMDFRREFKRDVVIDMYCYRRRGHNESDEPAFTHPLLYRAIEKRKSVRENYLSHLVNLGGVTREEGERIVAERTAELERELSVAKSNDYVFRSQTFTGVWKGYVGGREDVNHVPDPDTGIGLDRTEKLLESTARVPTEFHPHPKIEKVLEGRREMAHGKRSLDWSTGEALAFASLATEGHRIRLSGQDSTRGTFSQRHAVLHDYVTGERYATLQHLAEDQAPVDIWNSPLSEAGVLGFDYGYSLDCPNGLVLWEAQFGDFVNAAQVIIDQFICSAETKWQRLSGVVLLLPHGFEGMGPEHSSARLERFLTLTADHNIQVVVPTTPAQYFHCLRRQVLRPWRKPLVVMTPKSLLRHPKAVSPREEFTTGKFQRVIPDADPARKDVEGVLLCSGKIYYELDKERQDLGRRDVAIVRMEQLYPLPMQELTAALAPYKDGTPVYWVQEEPENMGAWRFLLARFRYELFDRLPFAGIYRRASSSPATGSASSHKMEQKELLMQAFGCI